MNNSLRQRLKEVTLFKISVITIRELLSKRNLLSKIKELFCFYKSYIKYKRLNCNLRFSLKTSNIYPRLFDNTKETYIDPVYFYQDTWCAKKIFVMKPSSHYDVGSKADLVGIISQFVPTTMVDIRPLPVDLPDLKFLKGTLLALPFKDEEISSLSSICVIEHIGLGRYGDPLDQYGSEKAAAELTRVLAPGGSLYISVPVDDSNKVYFNAHRAFTREYILEIFKPLILLEERYIYGNQLYDNYKPESGFGTGLFEFKKTK